MSIHLCRLDSTDTHTRGVLHIPGHRPWVTMEQPWRVGEGFGEPGRSCVPVGEYRIVNATSPSRGHIMWYLVGDGVYLRADDARNQERWGCMFHSANWAHQLAGCVALGWEWRTMRDMPGITDSQSAMAEFTAAMATHHNPVLTISEA